MKKIFFPFFFFFKPGSLCLHFCFFFKFPISPDLFPSGFIHDLHLEIISVHENKPSAILGKSLCALKGWRESSGTLLLQRCSENDI